MNNVTTRFPSLGRTASRWLPWALLPVAGLFLVKLTLRPVIAAVLIGMAFLTATASGGSGGAGARQASLPADVDVPTMRLNYRTP